MDLDDPVPDHSTFSKNRHGRFRDSDLFRYLFELVLARCIAEGLVGGEALGVDASVVQADAKRLNKVEASDWTPERVTRETEEYFETLDDAAFGAATPVKPKVLSPVDTAARFVGDGPYGNAETLGWLVHEKGIEPHVPVLDRSQRHDQTFSRTDFKFDHENDRYICPDGKDLLPSRRQFQTVRPKMKISDIVLPKRTVRTAR